MKSIVRWAISNAPAMNIVLVAGMLLGVFSMYSLRRETFPEFDLDMITISVPYPGATPADVEEGICQKIEEAVRSVEGIKKINSTAAEGVGSVMLELRSDVKNADRVLNDVRSAVDQIPSFPDMAEDPDVKLTEMRETVIRVGVVGPDDRSQQADIQLREVAEHVREELLLLPEVSRVDLSGGREYQIDIEISEDALRSHGVSLRNVAEVVRRENHQMPGGTLRAKSQEVLLRGYNRRTTGDEIAKLPLITKPDGAVLTIGDVGTVRDAFTDLTAISELDGRPVLVLSVQRNTTEDLLAMVDSVKHYAETANMPQGYKLATWADRSVEVRGRVNLLTTNGMQGLVIVFVLLAVFLDLRLAFWIALGIPFSLLATAAFLFFTGQTLNMISMFAFIMALGIVVDDAIVVGENIFSHREMGKPFLRAAIDGAVEVAPSVIVSVSTTIMAFMPLLFVSGMMGKIIAVMPVVIISMLFVSLVESLTILPCHLAHRDSGIFRLFHVVFFVFAWLASCARFVNRHASSGLDWFIQTVYAPVLHTVLAYRSVFVASCVTVLVITAGLVRSGHVPMVFFPKLDSNSLVASVTFPDGTPSAVTDRWTKHIEEAFWRVAEQYEAQGTPVAKSAYRVVGSQVTGRRRPGASSVTGGASNSGSVEIELVDATERSIKSDEIVSAWREEAGRVPGVESLTFGAMAHGPGGAAIEFKMTANQQAADDLDEIVDQCKEKLAEFPGVFDIVDDSLPGKWEFRLRVKDEAIAMGVNAADLAETVRATYYGQEVMRLQRGRHEVKLMVRYPLEDRHSLAAFNEIRVRTGDGSERPLTELADIDVVRGYSQINRLDQYRCVTISADVNEDEGNAQKIVMDLRQNILPDLLADHPGIHVRWEGQQEQQRESFQSMFVGFAVALLAMYVLLAFEFTSYLQPLLILAIVPFGMIGAVAGHLLLGIPLTIFSMFGLVALTGIVINDSIVLVDFINHRLSEGMTIQQAVVQAGCRRFRPVMLTSVTTVGGLTPILLEKSFQAQMLIPMATSIAFGVMFATLLVLLFVPVLFSTFHSFVGRDRSEDHDDVQHERDQFVLTPHANVAAVIVEESPEPVI
jgi:HAE1 family hydrophobic/amphiphilic exporter-1